MTVDELVQRFTAIGIEEDQALLRRQYATFNRLFGQMVAVEHELKARDGDQRRELLSLYNHPNAQVRLKIRDGDRRRVRLNAAKVTLAVAPEIARQALRALADSHEYPQAGEAGMSIDNLERGIFKPT